MAKHPGSAVPLSLLRPDQWVADIVYVPLETDLLRAARKIGCRTLDGGKMVVFQAARAFEIFTGHVVDTQRMLLHFDKISKNLTSDRMRYTGEPGLDALPQPAGGSRLGATAGHHEIFGRRHTVQTMSTKRVHDEQNSRLRQHVARSSMRLGPRQGCRACASRHTRGCHRGVRQEGLERRARR